MHSVVDYMIIHVLHHCSNMTFPFQKYYQVWIMFWLVLVHFIHFHLLHLGIFVWFYLFMSCACCNSLHDFTCVSVVRCLGNEFLSYPSLLTFTISTSPLHRFPSLVGMKNTNYSYSHSKYPWLFILSRFSPLC